MVEYAELEETHWDNQVQLLVLHRTLQELHRVPERIFQHSLNSERFSLFQCSTTLWMSGLDLKGFKNHLAPTPLAWDNGILQLLNQQRQVSNGEK